MTTSEMTAATKVDTVRVAADRVAAVRADDASRRAAVRAEFLALRARLAGRVDAYLAEAK